MEQFLAFLCAVLALIISCSRIGFNVGYEKGQKKEGNEDGLTRNDRAMYNNLVSKSSLTEVEKRSLYEGISRSATHKQVAIAFYYSFDKQ
jgi:hypothetical protein